VTYAPASRSHWRTGPAATWQSTPTAMSTLSPFGRWRIRLRNEDAAASLVAGQEHGQNRLQLDWLDDVLFVVSYTADIEYRFAS
jgi:hypothetical protein